MDRKSILADRPEILIRKYYQILLDAKIPVEKIIMFGSYAKGKTKPWSDLDICVVSKKFGKNYYDEMVLLNKLTTKIESMIEVHPYHPKDLLDKWDPLAAEIRKYGKTFHFSS